MNREGRSAYRRREIVCEIEVGKAGSGTPCHGRGRIARGRMCAKPAEQPAAPAEAPKTDVKAAMVTDVGGLGDKSFNDLSYAGLQKAESELGV